MKYCTIQPSAALSRHVRYFWVLEGEATFEKPYIHRSMADGCAELLFHYKGLFDELMPGNLSQRSFHSGLAGQSQNYSRYKIKEDFGIFGVYLYPYAITHLFSHPALDLANQMIDLQSLLGNTANELHEKMICAENNLERVAIITAYLQTRIRQARVQPPGLFDTIQYIIGTNGIASVKELAQYSCLSTRQFERKFVYYAGFSPKLFSRIVRFQHTLKSYKTEFNNLTELAFASGYYDQSHFIQDFKLFSGHHPKPYFSGLTESTEWKD